MTCDRASQVFDEAVLELDKGETLESETVEGPELKLEDDELDEAETLDSAIVGGTELELEDEDKKLNSTNAAEADGMVKEIKAEFAVKLIARAVPCSEPFAAPFELLLHEKPEKLTNFVSFRLGAFNEYKVALLKVERSARDMLKTRGTAAKESF